MSFKKVLWVCVFFMTACQSNPSSENTQTPLPNGGSDQTASPTPSATPVTSPSPSVTPTATPIVSPSPSATPSSSRGIALIFNGAGVCTDGCGQAGFDAATLAGFTPKYVKGTELSSSATQAQIDAFFANVKVWVMPGGYARNEVDAMSATMRSALKSFVQNGGGYVGWCAGAFAATSIVGTTGANGLGLMAGNTAVYSTKSKQNSYGGSIEKTTWLNEIRYLYLEGGPYFYNLPSSVEVVGRYDNNVTVSAVRSTYGKGRVFLTGTHPEAPSWWWSGTGISDPDGSDLNYAADMIKWAAQLQ